MTPGDAIQKVAELTADYILARLALKAAGAMDCYVNTLNLSQTADSLEDELHEAGVDVSKLPRIQ